MNIPTTDEMDGLFSEEDVKNKDTVMRQCRSCTKWTKMHIDERVPCQECGERNYDLQSARSLRTFNPLRDNKRKVK